MTQNAVSKVQQSINQTTKARVISITSGKGGVGKSSIALNLAIEFATHHKKICLLDADTNLANINIMTGLQNSYSLQDYIEREITLEQLVLTGPNGIHIIPSASGLSSLINTTSTQLQRYKELLQQLETNYDVILIDTAAGINDTVLSFIQSSSEVIFTITSEPTSLTDAFSLLKVLRHNKFKKPIQILLNKMTDYQQAKEIYIRFARAVNKYMGLKTFSVGYVLEDKNVVRSIMMQKAFTQQYPDSKASKCIKQVAKKIMLNEKPSNVNFSSFLLRDVEANKNSQDLVVNKTKSSYQNIDQLMAFIRTARHAEVDELMSLIHVIWQARNSNVKRSSEQPNKKDSPFYAAMNFAQKLK